MLTLKWWREENKEFKANLCYVWNLKLTYTDYVRLCL